MASLRILVLAMLAATLVPVSEARKEKASDKENAPADLGEWVRQQQDVLPEEVDGVRIFRPATQNGKAVVSDIIDLPGISPEHAFVAGLIFTRENLDPETERMGSIDYARRRYIVERYVEAGEGKTAASYSFNAAFQFADDLMSFQISDIQVGYREKGIVPRHLAAEKLKPATSERHKELIEEFSLLDSRYLHDMAAYIKANPDISVTHWADIEKGRVVKGMTPDEVMLVGGKPSNINKSGNREKWMYSNDFIVVFTEGVVSTVIQ